MPRTPAVLLFGAAVALAVAGCGSGSPRPTGGTDPATVAASSTGGGMQHVTIHGTNEFRFAPATVTAHVGMLRVTLIDDGSYPHNLAVALLHQTSRTVSGDPGGSTTTFTLNFTHPGTYTFVCTYHSSAGMKGQFIIR